MGPVFLIDESVYFYPGNQRLFCHPKEKEDKTLTQPAAKCLELLITTGGLVSQSDLYDYAWGDNSHNVSPNTLYQNISLIRRALKNVRPGADRWIITVPRKGFRFDHSIAVRQVTSEDTLPVALPEPFPPPVFPAKARPLNSLLPASLFVLCFALAFFIHPVNADFKNLTGSYDKIDGQEACQLYIYRNNLPLKEKINSRIKQYIDCNSRPYVYITYDKFNKKITFFSCFEPIANNSRSCASWLLGEAI